jgi:hypothetical protein
MIKPGDRVNHVYNMSLVGTVMQLVEQAGTEHFEGGTSARKFYAVVRLDKPVNGQETFTAATNDLMRE